ncbi:MAG: nucleotide exchange factor GrpE [Planctomycetes bacterium]|nr:nucleotide exchange factor GrpE [Planctomycetota bacterium]
MAEEKATPGTPEPETESSEKLEEEVPTEDQEPPAADTQASELATVEVLAQEIEQLRARAAERDDLLDRLQRTKADFSNYQKRQDRDRERWAEDARRAFALRVLPALDDLELALSTPQVSKDSQALLKALELIRNKLLAAFREEGIAPFEALGKPYDPAFHEAIAQIEKPGARDRTVAEEVRKGYMLGERVLRPARVVVAKAPIPPSP